MACVPCGWPGESDAHFPDCWVAYLHGKPRVEVQRLMDAFIAVQQERDTLEQQLARAREHLHTYHGGACAYFDPALPLPEDAR